MVTRRVMHLHRLTDMLWSLFRGRNSVVKAVTNYGSSESTLFHILIKRARTMSTSI